MHAGSGRKILIIEDESDVADLLEMGLRKAGFQEHDSRRRRNRFTEGARQPARLHRSGFDVAKNVRAGGVQNFERRRGNVSHPDSHVDGKSRRD